jgi:hypothetical protein
MLQLCAVMLQLVCALAPPVLAPGANRPNRRVSCMQRRKRIGGAADMHAVP